MRYVVPLCAVFSVLSLFACDRNDAEPGTEVKPSPTVEPVKLTGTWRGALTSPGGDLPFTLEFEGTPPRATIHNGVERVRIDDVSIDGRSVTLRFPHYDAASEATMDAAGKEMTGSWEKTTREGKSTLPFRAKRNNRDRFQNIAAGSGTTFAGVWKVVFTDDDGVFLAQGEFAESEAKPGHMTGTFLTSTGDYRYLEGQATPTTMWLSGFDGAHAFLFKATTQDDGTLKGDFWSRDIYHATWVAQHYAEGEQTILPDPYAEIRVTSEDGKIQFRSPDLDGKPVTLSDEQFQNKVVLVDLFGTWCPNCNDQAPLLQKWHEEFADRGLAVLGLAFEHTGDLRRDTEIVTRYRDRYRLTFPLLVAGSSKKDQAIRAVEGLSEIKSYPTTILIGRDGRVRKIHSGFAGPATGEHYERLIAETRQEIEKLLAEDK